MPYSIFYHPEIPKDLELINKNIQQRVAQAIENRLAAAPEHYGEPLRKTLKGYWKLRVGDYRVVFKITGQEIWVYGIIDRKDVYGNILKRLRWAP